MKNNFLLVLLTFSFVSIAQQSVDIKGLISNTQQKLEKAELKVEWCKSRLTSSLKITDTLLLQKMLSDVAKASIEIKELSDQAESTADKAEIEAKKTGCFTGAAEADDAEDYCRQLGYYTFEISIYTKKALKETESVYFKEYIYKALNYCELSYEGIKNAKLELSDAINDLASCE